MDKQILSIIRDNNKNYALEYFFAAVQFVIKIQVDSWQGTLLLYWERLKELLCVVAKRLRTEGGEK